TPSPSSSRDGNAGRQELNATFGSPPTVSEPTLMQRISGPSGMSGPLPATVRGGMARPAPGTHVGPTQSVPASKPGVSQASPMPSSSVSFWSGLYTSGQVSLRLRKPSPSWSVGWFEGGPVVGSSGVGSQLSGIPSGASKPKNLSLSPTAGTRGFQTVSAWNGQGSKEFS